MISSKSRDLPKTVRTQSGQIVVGLLALVVLITTLAVAVTTSLVKTAPSLATGDGPAKALAQTAQREAEKIGADHGGSYARIGILRLHKDNPTLGIRPSGSAWLSSASSTGSSYTVSVTAASTGNVYTITREPDGMISRSCTLAGRVLHRRPLDLATACSW